MQTVLGHITSCQLCEAPGLETVFSLGHLPPVHGHLSRETLAQPEITYPLNLCRCLRCGLVQLDYAVPPELLFPATYPYQTGMTAMLVNNFRALTNELCERYHLGNAHLAVDIGSNDGTLLQGFKDRGVRVRGVEPSDTAALAGARGIPTHQTFFTKAVAERILQEEGPAAVITATNVFAHVNNLGDFVAGVHTLLADDGIFVSESQYLGDILEKLELDTIYHEHLRYFSLKPLSELFSRSGFSLIDAERITAAGGSIRVYARKGTHPASARVTALLTTEERAGFYTRPIFDTFREHATQAKHELLALLLKIKKDGGRIVGVGAPARSNTLLGFSGIDHTVLEYAGEKTGSPKIGLFTPGTHIPIEDEARIFADQPSHALILSWHIGNELVAKLKERGYRGTCILPLPNPRFS